jgi:hypothetical protein
LRDDLLDEYGFFKPDKLYFNGMFIGIGSNIRIFNEVAEILVDS